MKVNKKIRCFFRPDLHNGYSTVINKKADVTFRLALHNGYSTVINKHKSTLYMVRGMELITRQLPCLCSNVCVE